MPHVWLHQQCGNFKCTTYSIYKRVCDLLKEKQTPLKKFRLLVVATTKGAVKTPARVGKPPNEQPQSPQFCHLKTRVHHLTQGVSYNDAGRWPRFGTQQGGCNVCKARVPCWRCSMWIWEAVPMVGQHKAGFCSISPKYTGYSAVFLSLMHSTLDNEFDLRLIQQFWWSLCSCVLIPNIS